jgi:hypothetical protein
MCGCAYVWNLESVGVFMCGFCKVWVCVCMDFVKRGCAFVLIVFCVVSCLCGLCKVWVCVCVGVLMCGFC